VYRVNFYTPYIFRSIGFDGTRVGLLASGMSHYSFISLLFCRRWCSLHPVHWNPTSHVYFWVFLDFPNYVTDYQQGMFALVKAMATILSIGFLVDRLGRRKLLLASSVGAGLSLWYIGGFVEAKNININNPQPKSAAGWVAIVCVYLYAVSCS
jgi:hypothetical protein